MMNEWIELLGPFAAGIMLGIIFFGGLLLTITNGVASRNPGLWFFASMLLRTGIVLSGFYLAGAGQFSRILACLAGFIIARTVITRLSGKQQPATEEQQP